MVVFESYPASANTLSLQLCQLFLVEMIYGSNMVRPPSSYNHHTSMHPLFCFRLKRSNRSSYLRPGEDDEKLLQCLELSDLSDCGDTSDDDCEDFIEPDEHDMDHPELDRDVQELIFEHDSDDESMSELRKKLLQQKSLGDGKHLSWTKMGCFVPPDVNLAEPEDTARETRLEN
nr:unnamed protein product [Callosobruchus chinensis]